MIIAFRHGYFELNKRSRLSGEAALQKMEKAIPPDADAIMDLLPEGHEQAEHVRRALAEFSVYACLHSPALRARTMAKLVLAGRTLPGGIHMVPGLRERSRGIFSYAPDDWSEKQPGYPARKSVLDWMPAGVDYNGNPGESIRMVRDTRVAPVLRFADQATPPGKTTALSGHAEWMLALRAYYLGFDDERFRQPLVPSPPENNRALATAKMIVHGQVDLYDCTCPTAVPAGSEQRHMDVFRTIIAAPEPETGIDTGWLDIQSM
ncbi:MAG TPA: histidine phosphatase family protein [Candidatus Saccharimonadales bacterium]|nr:histidine phosphatase family protein [Candidatus Saccharimonadales bacterium]